MEKDLNIKSNNIRRCVDCGIPITVDNDSGWEVFISGGITQSICAWCDIVRGSEMTGQKLEGMDDPLCKGDTDGH